jgi:predicted nuclease of predicted toxin-antitoxin system
VKLLLDEQISGRVAERLRKRGRDVVATTDEPALRGLGDSDLFEVAQAHSDFGRFVASLGKLLDEPPRGKSFTVWLQDA